MIEYGRAHQLLESPAVPPRQLQLLGPPEGELDVELESEPDPPEGLVGHGCLESSELANLCPDTIEEAAVHAENGLIRIRSDTELAFAFLEHCGLTL